MNLAPVVTFAIYVIISVFWKSETLLAGQAFTSITLIALLTGPLTMFIQSLPNVFSSVASFDRIQEYCNYGTVSEIKQDDAETFENRTGSEVSLKSLREPSQSQQQAIIFEGQSFGGTRRAQLFFRISASRFGGEVSLRS